MNYIEQISNTIGLDEIYIVLIIKTIFWLLLIKIIQRIGLKIIDRLFDSKKEYLYARKYKFLMNLTTIILLMFIWNGFIKDLITIVSIISAAFTIALRDLIFNFFCGVYIKIKKPFEVEDRIEINNYKGDVININALNFEVLEVNNETFIGQSTGVITHVPNSIIFTHPLRNYNKAFKYIWNEITIKIPLESDVNKAKGIIYKIVNSNEIIKNIPNKMKNQIKNSSSEYRIYYNQYDPTIYTQIIDNHIELTVRYLVHPKKARYVNSTIYTNIITSYQENELELYKD